MSRDLKWTVLSDRKLVERPWLTVHEQRVRLPNGHEIDEFHRIVGPDWAGIVALTPDQNLVLVRQYRHGVAVTSLELPAGVVDRDETALAAAQRELLEETGFVADDWHPLAVLNTEPARHTTRAHFFVATGARVACAPKLEPSEELEVYPIATRELGARIDVAEIAHGVHVGAILLAARRGFFRVD